ncbi:hypothetical protein DRJ25_03215 [Candidatus Woesearchaeota archaeon]|nr:MAG: hypothetical protein DRJ25_03215 [Candidatus Woesearchaeota archaeon]
MKKKIILVLFVLSLLLLVGCQQRGKATDIFGQQHIQAQRDYNPEGLQGPSAIRVHPQNYLMPTQRNYGPAQDLAPADYMSGDIDTFEDETLKYEMNPTLTAAENYFIATLPQLPEEIGNVYLRIPTSSKKERGKVLKGNKEIGTYEKREYIDPKTKKTTKVKIKFKKGNDCYIKEIFYTYKNKNVKSETIIIRKCNANKYNCISKKVITYEPKKSSWKNVTIEFYKPCNSLKSKKIYKLSGTDIERQKEITTEEYESGKLKNKTITIITEKKERGKRVKESKKTVIEFDDKGNPIKISKFEGNKLKSSTTVERDEKGEKVGETVTEYKDDGRTVEKVSETTYKYGSGDSVNSTTIVKDSKGRYLGETKIQQEGKNCKSKMVKTVKYTGNLLTNQTEQYYSGKNCENCSKKLVYSFPKGYQNPTNATNGYNFTVKVYKPCENLKCEVYNEKTGSGWYVRIGTNVKPSSSLPKYDCD